MRRVDRYRSIGGLQGRASSSEEVSLRVRHVLCLFVGIFLIVAGFGGTATALPNNKTDVIRGFGSDTNYPVQVAVDTVFNNTPSDGVEGCFVVTQGSTNTHQKDISCNPDTAGPPFSPENWDHDLAVSYFPVGSGNGITQLQNQGNPGWARIDYARSSSGRGTISTDFRFVAFARDGIGWINWGGETGSPAAAVTDLTLSELQGIFRDCTIDNWSDPGIGGNDAPIIVWANQAGSGTRRSIDSAAFLNGNSANCVDPAFTAQRTIFEHDPTPIRTCATSGACGADGWKSSIWLMGHAAWVTAPIHPTFGKAMGSRMGSLNGIQPNADSIGRLPGDPLAYSWARYVHNVYKNVAPNAATPATIDYVGPTGWICKGTSGAPDGVVAGTDSDSRGGHMVNRFTGRNWADLITDAIVGQGMARIAYGPLNRGGVSISGNARCIVF